METFGEPVHEIQILETHRIAILKLGGYVDQVTASELERALHAILRSKIYRIVIDLSDAEYVSSSGWGIFLAELKTLRANGGDLKLVGMRSNVSEVFELLELVYILQTYNTVDEAVTFFAENVSKES